MKTKYRNPWTHIIYDLYTICNSNINKYCNKRPTDNELYYNEI